MQLNTLILALSALTTTLALPHASTTTKALSSDQPARDWPKVISDPSASHSPSPEHGAADDPNGASKKDICPELCSLMAQACVVAVPNDEPFWWVWFTSFPSLRWMREANYASWTTYKECSKRCTGQ